MPQYHFREADPSPYSSFSKPELQNYCQEFYFCFIRTEYKVQKSFFCRRDFVWGVGTEMTAVHVIAYCSLCNCWSCCFQVILQLFSSGCWLPSLSLSNYTNRDVFICFHDISLLYFPKSKSKDVCKLEVDIFTGSILNSKNKNKKKSVQIFISPYCMSSLENYRT